MKVILALITLLPFAGFLFNGLGRNIWSKKTIAYKATGYIVCSFIFSILAFLNVQSGEPCEIWEKDSQGNVKFRIPNPKRQTYPSYEYYFKSSVQMATLFKDLPQSISNTSVIFEKCSLEIDFKTKKH